MSLDPAALPLLLAGPMLRRVESDLVCVWIATSQRCDVSLLLFEGTDVVSSSSPNDDLRAAWVSALQQTLQYGKHFHVLTVTLDLRSPGGNASRSAGQLKSNHGYSYDLRLHPQSDPTKPLNLRALGLLAGPIPLGYDLGELPSFKTAPEDRDKLVIVHGSCRRMFDTPPLADDPALDGPFPPPGGWPTEQPTPSDADSRPRAGGVSGEGLSDRTQARRLPLDRRADRSARSDAAHRDAPASAVPDRRPDLRRRRAGGAAAGAQPRRPRARRRRGTARRRGRQCVRPRHVAALSAGVPSRHQHAPGGLHHHRWRLASAHLRRVRRVLRAHVVARALDARPVAGGFRSGEDHHARSNGATRSCTRTRSRNRP